MSPTIEELIAKFPPVVRPERLAASPSSAGQGSLVWRSKPSPRRLPARPSEHFPPLRLIKREPSFCTLVFEGADPKYRKMRVPWDTPPASPSPSVRSAGAPAVSTSVPVRSPFPVRVTSAARHPQISQWENALLGPQTPAGTSSNTSDASNSSPVGTTSSPSSPIAETAPSSVVPSPATEASSLPHFTGSYKGHSIELPCTESPVPVGLAAIVNGNRPVAAPRVLSRPCADQPRTGVHAPLDSISLPVTAEDTSEEPGCFSGIVVAVKSALRRGKAVLGRRY